MAWISRGAEYRLLVSTAALMLILGMGLAAQTPPPGCPSDIEQSTDSGQPSATVMWPEPVGYMCNATSGASFELGSTPVTCINGSGDQCTFTVNVIDSENPMISCPDAITQPTDDGQNTRTVTWPDPQYSDNAGTVPASETCNPTNGSVFNLGPRTVRCTASDKAGNSAECTFMVTINDEERPTIECPDDISSGSGVPVTWRDPKTSDNVRVTANSCTPASGSMFEHDMTEVRCTASDAAGNSAECTFSVTISDTEAPSFDKCPPSPVRGTIQTVGSRLQADSVPVTWEVPIAVDNLGGEVDLQSSHEPGGEFPLGITRVVYNATDDAGNTNVGGCWFDVQVVVRPPDLIFTEDAGQTCFTVVWPESEDPEINEYSVYRWKEGDPRPAPYERTVVTSVQGAKNTYIRHELCRLTPGVLYTVEVNSGSGGTLPSTQQWTQPYTPASVTEVPGTKSSSSVELSWTRVSLQNAEQYRVTLSDGRDLGYVTNTTDRLMVDSLYPNREYGADVSAVVGSGEMRLHSASASTSFTTAALANSEVLAFNYTESTIALAWVLDDAAISEQDPIMLFIEPKDAKQNYLTFITDSPANPASAPVFEGLNPNTEYRIRLISNLGLALNTTQRTRPGRVGNVRATKVLDDSITLEWDPPAEGDVDSYEVYISPASGSEPIPVSSNSHVFSLLTNETEYFFKIVSVYRGMKSVPQTLMVTAGVTEPAPPPPLNFLAIGVGAGLGAVAIVLLISIVVVCVKYRRLKSQSTDGGYENALGLARLAQNPDDPRYQNSSVSDKMAGKKRITSTLPVPPDKRVSQSADPYDYADPNA